MLSPHAGAAAAEGWEVLHYAGGLAEYVRFLNRDKEAFHEPICFEKKVGGQGGGAAAALGAAARPALHATLPRCASLTCGARRRRRL